jgi:hypothetical protein
MDLSFHCHPTEKGRGEKKAISVKMRKMALPPPCGHEPKEKVQDGEMAVDN